MSLRCAAPRKNTLMKHLNSTINIKHINKYMYIFVKSILCQHFSLIMLLMIFSFRCFNTLQTNSCKCHYSFFMFQLPNCNSTLYTIQLFLLCVYILKHKYKMTMFSNNLCQHISCKLCCFATYMCFFLSTYRPISHTKAITTKIKFCYIL